MAAQPISKGDIFTEDNLTFKRPGTGLSPKFFKDILGKPAVRDFAADDFIDL